MYQSIHELPHDVRKSIPAELHETYVELFDVAWADLSHIQDDEARREQAHSKAMKALDNAKKNVKPS